MEHRHEYGPCCEHADEVLARMEMLELHVSALEERITPATETVVTEPVLVTGEETQTEPVDVDVTVNVDVEEKSSPEEHESEHEHESGHESESEHEEEPPDGEVVIDNATDLPELTESERERDHSHSLPMMR